MIRVLHAIETPGTGGAERVLVDVARSLSADFRSLGMTLVDGWTTGQLRDCGIETLILPLRRAFDLSWPTRFASLVREHAIDLVHCHEFTATSYAALGSALARIPLVSTIHGKNYWPERAYRRRALNWAARASHAFVVVSEDLKQFASSVLALPEGRIRVVPNGIDLKAFVPDAAVSAHVRAELATSPGDVVVVIVGALEPVKGHAMLIEAMAEVRRRQPTAKLWIVGEGYLRSELESQVKRLGLHDVITFLGWRTDVHRVLAAADFSVLASESEGMPLAVMESMACARPVVATRVGGLAELINSGIDGILVEPGCARELAQAMCLLVAEPQRRVAYGAASRERARQRFSLESMCTAYEHIYCDAVTK